MAERTVKVRLSAQVAEYQAGMAAAAKATRETGTEAEKLTQKREAFQLLGRSVFVAGGLMAAGLGVAVAKAADFDQAMSYVQAATHESAETMDALRDAALDAGATTVFSATESANAIEELGKAGLTAKDILGGGLKGSLDLAAAGGLGVADAAEIAATTLKQFQLDGSDASHVADLLAAGAGKAQGDVSDMSQALKQSGLVANQFGLSVEETTGTLAAFAGAGLLGSDAGTSFRTMLLRLANPTKEVRTLMEDLGLEAYDASGQFVGMAKFSGNLEVALKDMTDEQKNTTLAMIFGSDAIRGANVLLQEGEEGIKDWTRAVDDQGYAAETAAIRLDNLKGDWEALSGAVDSALISMGSGANEPLRLLTQGLTGVVDVFNAMPEGGQQAVFWIGAAGAAALTAGGLYLLAVPKVAAYSAAVATMGPAGIAAGRGLAAAARGAGVLGAATIAVVGVDALAGAITKNLLPSAEKIDNQMRRAKTGVDLFAAALTSEGFDDTRQAADLLNNLGKELDAVARSDFWSPASTSGTAVTVAKELAEIASSGDMALFSAQFRKLGEDAGLTEAQMMTFITTNDELENALTTQATSAGLTADAQDLLKVALGDTVAPTEDNTDALAALAGEAVNADGKVEDLADTIRNFGSAQFDVRGATRDFQQAVDDLTASITENGNTLDVNEQAGRDNEAALDAIAQSALDVAAATYTQTGSQEEATAALATGRAELIKSLEQFGITGQAAEDYADNLGLIPENIDTSVQVLNVPEAEAAITQLTRARWLPINLNIQGAGVNADRVKALLGFDVASADGNIFSYANGGFASGIFSGGTPIHKFAEPETGWEAYISGKPSERNRNIGLWQDTGRRLGVTGAGTAGMNLTVNVHATKGMDESQVGRVVIAEVERLIK